MQAAEAMWKEQRAKQHRGADRKADRESKRERESYKAWEQADRKREVRGQASRGTRKKEHLPAQ